MSWLSLFIFILFLFTNQISALNSDQKKQIDLTYQLAENLKKDGLNNQALLYFNDFIELYPDSEKVKNALWNMASIYEGQQQFTKTIATLDTIHERFGTTEDGLRSIYEKARLLEYMGLEKESLQAYHQIIKLNANSSYSEKARLRIKLLEVVQIKNNNSIQDDRVFAQ